MVRKGCRDAHSMLHKEFYLHRTSDKALKKVEEKKNKLYTKLAHSEAEKGELTTEFTRCEKGN